MGGTKSRICNLIANEIWTWSIDRNIWLSAEHLPGSKNVLADEQSRVFDDTTEWMINRCVFLELVKIFSRPAIDLFASRLNKQVTTFVSWKPDPNTLFIDAYSRAWHELNLYEFPPFSVVGRCVNKIKQEKEQGMIILPLWPAQTWFPIALQMMTSAPVLLPPDSIQLPYKNKKLPLHKTLQLMACQVSGDPLKGEEFRSLLSISLSHHGGNQLSCSINAILRDGTLSVMNGLKIPITQMKLNS